MVGCNTHSGSLYIIRIKNEIDIVLFLYDFIFTDCRVWNKCFALFKYTQQRQRLVLNGANGCIYQQLL